MGMTLGELFDRNPLELTKEDRAKIILALRERRETWVSEQNAAKSEGRKAKTSKNTTPKKSREVDLDGIDLDGLDL